MGQDDENEGASPGECPGHEWQFEEAVPTEPTRWGLVGLNVVETCRWCETIRYQPSALEQS